MGRKEGGSKGGREGGWGERREGESSEGGRGREGERKLGERNHNYTRFSTQPNLSATWRGLRRGS